MHFCDLKERGLVEALLATHLVQSLGLAPDMTNKMYQNELNLVYCVSYGSGAVGIKNESR